MPDGKICICLINAPGTLCDSYMADYGICKGMERVYVAICGKVVVDSIFNPGQQAFIIKSS